MPHPPPPESSPPPPDQATRLARGARRVGAFTMLSRLLGLLREQLFFATLGATGLSDAFLVAFRIPSLLRDLFAEGALSSAFVPRYMIALRGESRAAAFALANRVLSTLTIYLGALAVAAMLFPHPIVRLFGGGFDAATADVCAELVRIMMPFLPTISLAVVAMGILNAEERYTAPALASSMFNTVAIVGGALLLAAPPSHRAAVTAWAALAVVGGLAQLAVQVPPLRRLGFRFRFTPDVRLADPGTRGIAALMAPAAVGVAAEQVNVAVNSWFASHIVGGASWLNAAFRLMHLPIGVFGVAVGTASLTHLSRDAAAGDMPAMRDTLRRALRLVFFLTVPSTIGLALLAEPIVRLIFEHGRFTPGATLETARAVRAYAVGLVAYSGIKVMAPAFYALSRPRLPLAASAAAVAANLIWNLVTFQHFGHVGLALGTSVAAIANFLILIGAFQLAVGGLLTLSLLGALTRILAAAGLMAGVVWLIAAHLPGALAALGSVVVGAAVYFAAARALRLSEASTLLGRFGR